MDNGTKVYRIVIDGIKESTDNLSTLGGALDKVNSQLEAQIANYNKEYQQSIERNKRALQDLNKETKAQIDLEKAQKIVAEGNVSTYKKKQELLTALGKVIKNMTTETEAEVKQQQELKAQYASLNQELKDFDASLGNHQRNVGNYESGVVSLNQQLKEMEKELAVMLDNGVSKNDKAFVELAKKAGKLRDAIGDAKQEVNRFASDTRKLDNVIGVAQTATAAFQLWKGAMSAFGIESENAEKAIQKLAGAMSIVQSLKSLQEVMQQGGTAAKLLNGAMKVLGVEFMTNSVNAMKAAVANKELTLAEKAGTVATKTLSTAMRAIPLMFLIGLIVDMVNHWEDWCDWLKESGVDVVKLNDWLGKLGSGIKAVGRAITTYLVGAFGTFSDIVSKVFSGDFKGAYEAWKEGWKLFGETYDAFVNEFNDSEQKRQENMVKNQAAADAELIKKQIARLEAEKGNQAKYSKEGQKLYKDYYNKLEEAAKGDKNKLDEIANERLAYERECNEKSVADYKKSLKEKEEASLIAEKGALEAEQKRLEDQKSVRDVAEKEFKYFVDRQLKIANELYELYKNGPVEELEQAYTNLLQLISSSQDSEVGMLSVDTFDKAHELLPDIAKDTKTWSQYVNDIYYDLLGGGSKEGLFDGLDEGQQAFMRNLLLSFEKIKDELSDANDKLDDTFLGDKIKIAENTKNVEALKDAWADYIDYLTTKFGPESKQVQDAIDAQIKSVAELNKQLGGSSSGSTAPEAKSKWFGGKVDPKANAILGDLASEISMFADSVFNPINDAFATMLAFQLEEAQAALDEATDMHERSVDKVSESKDRIQELNDEMRDAEGANLEALKAQQADELNLLAQREAEEKRLAKEKEKREKEVEKLQQKQRKNELRAQLAQAIVNTAQAVSKTYANYGWPLGAVFGAIIAALGMAQVATISGQMSKFANGGVLPNKYANGGVIDGKSHAQGGVKVFGGRVELEGNEMIVNKRDTSRYLDVLQKINRNDPTVRYLQGNHGTVNDVIKKKFADGGTLNYQGMNETLQSVDMVYAIRSAVEGINVQVAVTDIAKGMKGVAQVRELSGAKPLM